MRLLAGIRGIAGSAPPPGITRQDTNFSFEGSKEGEGIEGAREGIEGAREGIEGAA